MLAIAMPWGVLVGSAFLLAGDGPAPVAAGLLFAHGVAGVLLGSMVWLASE